MALVRDSITFSGVRSRAGCGIKVPIQQPCMVTVLKHSGDGGYTDI